MKRNLLLMVVLLFASLGIALAQNTITVTGKVLSESDGQPVAGAYVLVNGTTIGTITNDLGEFGIKQVPTSAKELAKVVKYFIDNDEYGLYHAVCKGNCSRYEFAKAILDYTGNAGKLEVHPVLSSDTSRPEYCVLDNMMLRLSGIEEPAEWRVALKEYLDETGGLE